MKINTKITTIKRVDKQILSIITVLMLALTGVTYAALQSQSAILQGNTIQTATANLQLSSNGTTYSSQLDGYSFVNLIPGGQPTPLNGYPVYLKNSGSTPLSLKLSISKPVTNADNVDLSKVHVLLSPMGAGAGQNIPLQDLVTTGTNSGVALTTATRIIPSQSLGYTLQVSMDADAISGPSATISNVDFSFGATAVN